MKKVKSFARWSAPFLFPSCLLFPVSPDSKSLDSVPVLQRTYLSRAYQAGLPRPSVASMELPSQSLSHPHSRLQSQSRDVMRIQMLQYHSIVMRGLKRR